MHELYPVPPSAVQAVRITDGGHSAGGCWPFYISAQNSLKIKAAQVTSREGLANSSIIRCLLDNVVAQHNIEVAMEQICWYRNSLLLQEPDLVLGVADTWSPGTTHEEYLDSCSLGYSNTVSLEYSTACVQHVGCVWALARWLRSHSKAPNLINRLWDKLSLCTIHYQRPSCLIDYAIHIPPSDSRSQIQDQPCPMWHWSIRYRLGAVATLQHYRQAAVLDRIQLPVSINVTQRMYGYMNIVCRES